MLSRCWLRGAWQLGVCRMGVKSNVLNSRLKPILSLQEECAMPLWISLVKLVLMTHPGKPPNCRPDGPLSESSRTPVIKLVPSSITSPGAFSLCLRLLANSVQMFVLMPNMLFLKSQNFKEYQFFTKIENFSLRLRIQLKILLPRLY